MSDPASLDTFKDIISSIGVLVAIIISIIGLIRSSRQKQSDQLTAIEKSLNDHILEDEHHITELQADVRNLNNNVSNKLDTIIRELDK